MRVLPPLVPSLISTEVMCLLVFHPFLFGFYLILNLIELELSSACALNVACRRNGRREYYLFLHYVSMLSQYKKMHHPVLEMDKEDGKIV